MLTIIYLYLFSFFSQVSNVSGLGLDNLRSFLNHLPRLRDWSALHELPSELTISEYQAVAGSSNLHIESTWFIYRSGHGGVWAFNSRPPESWGRDVAR